MGQERFKRLGEDSFFGKMVYDHVVPRDHHLGWLILVRLRRAPGAFVQGDRRHLHSRLLDLGLSQRQVVLAYASISAAFGLLALEVSSRSLELGALVVLGVAILVGLRAVASRSEQ